MKNYVKTFEDANKAMIGRIRVINIFANIIIVIFMIILYGGILKQIVFADYPEMISFFEKDPVLRLFLFSIPVFVSTFLSVILLHYFDYPKKLYTRTLQKKTKEFALKGYLEDMMYALQNEFVLTDEFKVKLNDTINNICWLNYERFIFDDKVIRQKEIGHNVKFLKINHNEYVYYLTGWRHSTKLGFVFAFDRINTKNFMESLFFIETINGEILEWNFW